ncbi:hypothetical protein H4R35_005816 [Dimargaris xerosporica]|nr:hypothetical protein H4R35_005816 [Dimargaris xerosporica]
MDLGYDREFPTRYSDSESDTEVGPFPSSDEQSVRAMPKRRRDYSALSHTVTFRWSPAWHPQPHSPRKITTLVVATHHAMSAYLATNLAKPVVPVAVAFPFEHQPHLNYSGGALKGANSYYILIQQSSPETAYILLSAAIGATSQRSWVKVLLDQLQPKRVVVLDGMSAMERSALQSTFEPSSSSSRLCYLQTAAAKKLDCATEISEKATFLAQGIGATFLTQCQLGNIPAYLLVDPFDDYVGSAWNTVLASGLIHAELHASGVAQVSDPPLHGRFIHHHDLDLEATTLYS